MIFAQDETVFPTIPVPTNKGAKTVNDIKEKNIIVKNDADDSNSSLNNILNKNMPRCSLHL